jgi:hypothetical protein
MAWCDACESWHAPTALTAQGTCPKCGAEVEATEVGEERTVGQSAPWHFWIVVVALAAYLLWRLIDGILWLVT